MRPNPRPRLSRTVPAAITAAIIAANAAGVRAAETVVMTAADPDGGSITFAFDKAASPPVLVLRTEAVAVAHSALSLYVDKSQAPTWRHDFTEAECSFPGGGASRCATSVPKGDAAYDAIVAIFRAGKEARIAIDHGGAMGMDHTASLIGFTRAFDE